MAWVGSGKTQALPQVCSGIILDRCYIVATYEYITAQQRFLEISRGYNQTTRAATKEGQCVCEPDPWMSIIAPAIVSG